MRKLNFPRYGTAHFRDLYLEIVDLLDHLDEHGTPIQSQEVQEVLIQMVSRIPQNRYHLWNRHQVYLSG